MSLKSSKDLSCFIYERVLNVLKTSGRTPWASEYSRRKASTCMGWHFLKIYKISVPYRTTLKRRDCALVFNGDVTERSTSRLIADIVEGKWSYDWGTSKEALNNGNLSNWGMIVGMFQEVEGYLRKGKSWSNALWQSKAQSTCLANSGSLNIRN